MTTHLERRWGGGGENPHEKEMREALDELATPDLEHPDCWLTDENGWTVSAYQTGLVVIECLDSGEGPWHMESQKPEDIIALWKLLQAGDIPTLRSQPWVQGYKPKVSQ